MKRTAHWCDGQSRDKMKGQTPPTTEGAGTAPLPNEGPKTQKWQHGILMQKTSISIS